MAPQKRGAFFAKIVPNFLRKYFFMHKFAPKDISNLFKYMKKKIEEALKTEFKELGLSDKTIGRLADYVQGLVEKEEDIATAVKRDDVKLIAKSIQGELDGLKKAKEKAEADLADYKAKHPDQNVDVDTDKDKDKDKETPLTAEAIAKLVKDAASEAVKTVKDEFDAYKAQVSGKEAVANAKKTFYENKWTTKFKDEADDAWERAHELNEAKGGSMSQEDLTKKATEYFNKAVQRKGTDATKPFEEGSNENGNYDFSAVAKHLEDKGELQPIEQK